MANSMELRQKIKEKDKKEYINKGKTKKGIKGA